MGHYIGEIASDFFCECFRDNVSLDLRLDVELLEAPGLILKLLHPRHQRHVHPGDCPHEVRWAQSVEIVRLAKVSARDGDCGCYVSCCL